MRNWFEEHKGRYSVLVAEQDDRLIGWSSLDPYSHRCAYNGVPDLSIYIDSDYRGNGIGSSLTCIENQSNREWISKDCVIYISV
jgi:phosphinothricin acetyltransferase